MMHYEKFENRNVRCLDKTAVFVNQSVSFDRVIVSSILMTETKRENVSFIFFQLIEQTWLYPERPKDDIS